MLKVQPERKIAIGISTTVSEGVQMEVNETRSDSKLGVVGEHIVLLCVLGLGLVHAGHSEAP